jgi:hypothetical protein
LAAEHQALAVALDHAQRRGMDVARARVSALASIDQWTVSSSLDPLRPLFRVSLNDQPDTELYVSSITGEVVRDTTRRERWWNYAGSVAHWIYPTALRSRPAVWNATVWWLSFAALIAALAGSMLGIYGMKAANGRSVSSYQGWHKWHHLLGLACMIFVLSWIFSGWLSMDSGRLFSTGALTTQEAGKIASAPAPTWDSLSKEEWRPTTATAKEIEWLVFDEKFYRRERMGLETQRLFAIDADAGTPAMPREFLEAREVGLFVERLASGCNAPIIVTADDNYGISSPMPHAPLYRSVCGEVWYHVDGASGMLLERLDPSRRAYRWLYSALHTLDIPALAVHPAWRSALILILCGCGFVFSLTGVVIGWRRLRLQFSASGSTLVDPSHSGG